MVDRELIRGLEERLVNVWPAVETLIMDGWVIRLANGYTGRANSASPLAIGAGLTAELIDEIERVYAQASLPSCVRVTPVCDPTVEAQLLARGYRVKDRSRIMLLDLQAYRDRAPEPRVTIERKPSQRWLSGVAAHQVPEKRNVDHLNQIVSRMRVPAGFATLTVDGGDVGFGLCAIDRGYAEIGSIILDAKQRGKGLGRATVDALLVFAARESTHHAFLQVDATNAVAISLYASQGFEDIGGYLTMIRP
jgi:N-acetylglutamate synthase